MKMPAARDLSVYDNIPHLLTIQLCCANQWPEAGLMKQIINPTIFNIMCWVAGSMELGFLGWDKIENKTVHQVS